MQSASRPDAPPQPDEFEARVPIMCLQDKPQDLVLGVCRPLGTDTTRSLARIAERLAIAGFTQHRVRVSRLIASTRNSLQREAAVPTEVPDHTPIDLKQPLMVAGDYLRQLFDPSIAARLAISEISRIRATAISEAQAMGRSGVAFVVTHFMHPAEVSQFRAIYKNRFFLIGLTEPLKGRRLRIIAQLESRGIPAPQSHEIANTLISIDEGRRASNRALSASALSVDDTFHQADLFIDVQSKDRDDQIDRFFDQVFGNPFGALQPQERGMALAYVAAQSSAALGRRVGAAVIAPNGSVVGVGWNDPAAAGGGTYYEGSQPDHRDHVHGADVGDRLRLDAAHEFLDVLLGTDAWKEDVSDLVDDSARLWLNQFIQATHDLDDLPRGVVNALPALGEFRKTRIMNLIEFGRPLHAEMAAITQAVRSGYSTQDSTMFVTTYPCHECARNIVAAGVQRVVYIEPYGKSLAALLYSSEIDSRSMSDPYRGTSRVSFELYSGISPKRFDELFSWVERKVALRRIAHEGGEPGSIVKWARSDGQLRSSVRGYSSATLTASQVAAFNVSRLLAERVIAEETQNEIAAIVDQFEVVDSGDRALF